jgi:hypothetical protein
MKRRLVAIVAAALLAAAGGSAYLVAGAAGNSSGSKAREVPIARQLVGYWMGIDPLDGGDSRRSITRRGGGKFALIGRDTVFTLCDGTDRAIVTDTGLTAAGSALASDDFVIACTNNNSTIRLRVRYDVLSRNVIRETLVTQAGEPVDKIVFHRVSVR